MEFIKLSKNPIAEALIQFRFQCTKPVTPSDLKNLLKLFPDSKSEEIKEITFGIVDGKPAQSETVMGYRIVLTNGYDIIQLEPESFSFSRIGPYENWNKFRDTFLANWKILEQNIHPVNVQRIGTRYVNKILLPTDLGHVDLFMRLSPHISFSPINTHADEYFLRIGMPIREIDGRAIVTHVLDKSGSDGLLPIILDIDVFVIKDVKPELASQNETLDKLRDYKNQIFYNSFTDKGLELYK